MRFAATVILPLLLGGCLTPQERAQNSSGLTPQQQGFYDFFVSQGKSKDEAIILAVNPELRQLYFDDKTCLSYGAKPGSDAYIACRTQLEVSHRAPKSTPVAPVVVQAAPSAPARFDPPPPVTCLRTGNMTTCN